MRRLIRGSAAALVLGLAAGACDDDPSGPSRIPLAEMEGLYSTATVTFDPQGSAPAADVLAVLEAAGTSPTLNIGTTGSFQLFFRDPVTRDIVTLGGNAQASSTGVTLVFTSQEQADQFLLPRTLPLEWDAEAESLSFSGDSSVSQARLLELFPELYADEQFLDPTPGTLAVTFERESEE